MTTSTMNNDSSHLHSIHHMPGTALSTLHRVIHLILLTTLHGEYYHYPHLADKETEAQSNLLKFTEPGKQDTVSALEISAHKLPA